MTNQSIAPEVIAALRVLRTEVAKWFDQEGVDAVSVLDNAGIFAAIDAATECTCPQENVKFGGHLYHCPKVHA